MHGCYYIDAKDTASSKQTFQSNDELRAATIRSIVYSNNPDYRPNYYGNGTPYLLNRFRYCDPEQAEEMTCLFLCDTSSVVTVEECFWSRVLPPRSVLVGNKKYYNDARHARQCHILPA